MIDEEPFCVLYCEDNGTLNTPVKEQPVSDKSLSRFRKRCYDYYNMCRKKARIMKKCRGKSQEAFMRELKCTYESLVRKRNLAQYLRITPERFIDTYLEKEEYGMNYQTKHKPCDF